MKKIILPIMSIMVLGIVAGASFILAPATPKSQMQVQASSVVMPTSDVVTAEYTVTFQTIDGDVLAKVQTVNARIPIEYIPNPPTIYLRPFLRWTNIQGYSLDGLIQADITFLPLYSYDPQFKPDDADVVGKPNEVKKTQWLFFNYLLNENQILFGGLIIFGVGIFLLFIFLTLLRGVFK